MAVSRRGTRRAHQSPGQDVAVQEVGLREKAADDHGPADREPASDVPAEPRRRPVNGTRGRASVPRWDSFMLGGDSPR